MVAINQQLCQFSNVGVSHQIGPSPNQLLFQAIRNRLNGQDLLFYDANKVVIERRPSHDILGGLFQMSRLINQHRRIAWTSSNTLFASRHRSSHNTRPASYHNQRSPRMPHQLVSAFNRRHCNAGNQVVRSSSVNHSLIQQPNRVVNDPLCRWMPVYNNRVSSGNHSDAVVNWGLSGICSWGNRTNNPVRSPLCQCQTVVACISLRTQDFRARRLGGG
ncbi:MAG: hypothetical protein BWX66_00448 [Deltaproteobacteria bacterium ADurb.Bin058]|nr:MAG: hypothetical protein BWX66_00448 [Deltaproteobacteria bacterium ADurb.Bin058]